MSTFWHCSKQWETQPYNETDWVTSVTNSIIYPVYKKIIISH